jgi:hypothetical protein
MSSGTKIEMKQVYDQAIINYSCDVVVLAVVRENVLALMVVVNIFLR